MIVIGYRVEPRYKPSFKDPRTSMSVPKGFKYIIEMPLLSYGVHKKGRTRSFLECIKYSNYDRCDPSWLLNLQDYLHEVPNADGVLDLES